MLRGRDVNGILKEHWSIWAWFKLYSNPKRYHSKIGNQAQQQFIFTTFSTYTKNLQRVIQNNLRSSKNFNDDKTVAKGGLYL